MTKNSVRLLVVFVALTLIAIPVFAKRGGVKVSEDNVACGTVDKETTRVDCTIRVWVNLSSPNAAGPTSTWDWTNKDKGAVVQGPNDFGDAWNDCGDGYFWNDISIGGVNGSHTLEVNNASGENVGSDSFLLVCD